MSYDLRLAVKAEGKDGFLDFSYPKLDHPTYNLGQMFRACTGWDFQQSEYYRCSEVIDKIEKGIRELKVNSKKYKKYEPDNGWGTLESATRALESLRDCIYETSEEREIGLEYMYVAW